MSTSEIPNLNTLKRGGLRGRGRGGTSVIASTHKSKDEIVQDTDNDAASSRLSAVALGYLEDPFARLITTTPVQRRLPLMNRGTYVRTTGIDKIVDTFITSHGGRKQIVSLGAGSDTRYFRLRRKYSDLDLIYHEVDFETNTKSKIERLKSATFKATARTQCQIDIDEFEDLNGNLTSSNYYIHAQDLRKLSDKLAGFNVDLPTLLISECCLIYLAPDEAENVLNFFTAMFSNAPLAIAIYEPIRPSDPFGRTMVRNLITRGIQLQTLEKYAELENQRSRLERHNFESRAEDVNFIWRHWIDERERERIEGLEWMDEVEEFVLLVQHYCISWGWRGWTDETHWKALPASLGNTKQ